MINGKFAAITEVVHVIYCGHGTKSGKLPTADGASINLIDIVDQIPSEYVGQTIIQLDCCYSGHWIDQAKDLEKKKALGDRKLKIIAHCDKSK